jgi:hypothetical protein
MRVFVCLVLLFSAALANAGDKAVYRFVDHNGRSHYTDKPPYRGAKPLALANQALPTAKRKWEDAASAEIIRRATRFAVHFNAPSPDQAYTDPASGVHTVLHGIGAGAHQITAVLVSSEGRELAHSTPVSIRVKAPPAEN